MTSIYGGAKLLQCDIRNGEKQLATRLNDQGFRRQEIISSISSLKYDLL